MSLSQRYIGTESGLARQSTPPGGGLTSVGLSMPAPFSVAGSPLTANGVLGVTLAPQVANTVWAAPDGASGAPSFRALVAGDIPSLDASKITTGVLGTARLGTGLADATTFLRGDGTWQTPPSGFADPMTSIGDMIIRNGSNVTARLGIGTTDQVLRVVGGAPTWSAVPAPGSNTQVVYNNSGALGAHSGLVYNSIDRRLQVLSVPAASYGFLVSGSARSAGGASAIFSITSESSVYLNYYPSGGQPHLRSAGVFVSRVPDYLPLMAARNDSGHTSGTVMPYLHFWVQPTTVGVAGEGASILWNMRTSDGTMQNAATYYVAWSDAVTATRSAYHVWETVHLAGASTERMRLTSDGVLRVGTSAIYFGLRPGGSGTPVWTMPTADGTSGQVLSTDGAGILSWITAGGFVDPMTSIGDMIIRNGSNVTARMGIGATGQILQVVGGVPTWTTVGATTQVFYNNGGLPSGESSFTWSTANKTLSISASNTSFTGLNVFGATRSLTALGTFNVTSGSAQGQVFLGYSGGQGNSSVLAIATSSSMAAIRAMLSTGTVNAVEDAIIIQSGMSGFSPSAGFGAAVMTRLVSGSTGTYYDAGRHAVVWSDATTATRSAYHAWSTVHLAGALTERMRLTSDGVLRVGTSAVYFGLRPGGSGTPVWTMPTADGTSGQVLSTDGAGVLSWITAGGFSDPMTTNGDIIIRSGGVATRLGIGTAGQVLTVVSGLPAWQNAASGFSDPMTTAGDIIHRNGSNVTARLGVGTNGQVLTVFSGVPAWLDAYVDPMTTNGDLVYRSGGFASRLPIGTSGQVLTVVSGLPAWAAAAGFADPMTTIGDIIHRNGSNVTSRLGIGSTGQVLTVVSGVPAWASVYADPMTTIGDLVHRNGSNVTARLSVGSTGQVLTVVSGVPAWAAVYSDPLTTNGDIVIRSGGTTTRLPIGSSGQYLRVSSGAPTWETVAIMSDPMTTAGDVIIRNGSNVTARLGIGTTNQVLTVVSGVPAWATPFVNPMTTDGDIIFQNSGTPQRLGLGGSGQVLTVVGSTPLWANAYQNPMTTNGDLVTQVAGNPSRIGIGSTNQVLRVVSGAPTWATPPAVGSTGYVQFNNSGDLSSSSLLFWDSSNSRLGVGTSSPGLYRTRVDAGTNGYGLEIAGAPSAHILLNVNNTSSSNNSVPTVYVTGHNNATPTAALAYFSQRYGRLVELTHSETTTVIFGGQSLLDLSTRAQMGYSMMTIRRLLPSTGGWNAVYQPSIELSTGSGIGSGTGATGSGTGIDVTLITSTSSAQASSLRTIWSDATHATRTSYMSIHLSASGTYDESVRILAGGQINLASASGEYLVNNTKVVGARITGWQMPTGTQTRTTFDTAVVTLPHLAERVYALINDLYGHGLIGN